MTRTCSRTRGAVVTAGCVHTNRIVLAACVGTSFIRIHTALIDVFATFLKQEELEDQIIALLPAPDPEAHRSYPELQAQE